MEITKTKTNVSVIFTGSHYFFYSDWSGLFAVAERDYEKQEKNESHFSLSYGNEHLQPNWCKETAKRFISRAECKHVHNTCYYDTENYEELNKTRNLLVTAEIRK